MISRLITILAVLSYALTAHAYPDEVNETVNLGIGQATGGMSMINDNRYMFVGHTDVLKRIDLGTLTLTTEQPPELTVESGTEGNIKGSAYSISSQKVYASQDDGDVLAFSTTSITSNPSVIDIITGRSLGPVVIDTSVSPNDVYIGNGTDGLVYVLPAGSSSISRTITLKQSSEAAQSITINDMLYVPATDELYVATNIGTVYYVASGSTQANAVVIDPTKAANLVALDSNYPGTKVYAVDSTSNNCIYVIATSNHEVAKTIDVDSKDNTSFSDIAVMRVDSPGGAYYGFVSGQRGITLFDTAADTLVDVNSTGTCIDACPISTRYYGYLIASGDHYLYMSSGGGEISVITENPYIDFPEDIIYYDSTEAVTTALTIGGKVKVTFRSDIAGTYKVRANGSIDASGTVLTDINGGTGGSVAADTSTPLTFAYDTNKSALIEGDNIFFFFVTDSNSLTGRMGITVVVDTPPDPVVLRSTNFGNGRAYVTFDRLTAADMNHYHVYVDTDPVAVRTKTTVAAAISQPSSGGTVTGEVNGLTNGSTYYIAVEGVDNNGNVGVRGYLLPDGTEASAEPQRTVGPAAYSGETGGCSLIRTN